MLKLSTAVPERTLRSLVANGIEVSNGVIVQPYYLLFKAYNSEEGEKGEVYLQSVDTIEVLADKPIGVYVEINPALLSQLNSPQYERMIVDHKGPIKLTSSLIRRGGHHKALTQVDWFAKVYVEPAITPATLAGPT